MGQPGQALHVADRAGAVIHMIYQDGGGIRTDEVLDRGCVAALEQQPDTGLCAGNALGNVAVGMETRALGGDDISPRPQPQGSMQHLV